MNVKYGIYRCAFATSAACATLLFAIACNDDLDFKNVEGKQIAFKISAPNAWHDGMQVKENEPTTHCLSVKELSGDGDTKLYLHTVVAENPAENITMDASRGTPIKNLTAFKDEYSRFSLSGVCYNGDYPTDETQNDWTTEYAYNLYYSTSNGQPTTGGRPLLWPYDDKVKFFAFAPTVEDFNAMKTGGSLAMSAASHKGSPTITYTVPADVEEQIDLMTVRTDFSFSPAGAEVELKFGHALTAVRIACGNDMLAGKISQVTISGIYGSGSQVIGSQSWEPDGTKATYTISKEITLPVGTSADKVHADNGTPIAGTDSDNLTFILMPQTLPENASITIVFTDAATGTERTITGSIGGQKWKAGKIITYSISPSSIHIIPSLEFCKKPASDIMPYSGVWYNMKYNPAKVEITQADVENAAIEEIPADLITYQYKIEDDPSSEWQDCQTGPDGMLSIEPQEAYKKLSEKFSQDEVGSPDKPVSVTVDGETANCYLVDKAGYYSLPLVYGNGNVTGGRTNGLNYYPNHDDARMPENGKISGAADAVLCWQDAPDLIDSASVDISEDNLVFRIRKPTLTQGNALLAVRNSAKEILWSWHIWVTPYKDEFYSSFFRSKTYYNKDGADNSSPIREYDLAKYNLGWCDPHAHNKSRNFSIRAIIDMSAYGGAKEHDVEIGTFTQDVFKGSDAGDNTYYQWGRKDPMLGGIYNDYTIVYKYTKKKDHTATGTPDTYEFTMENKQVFNQYKEYDGNNEIAIDYSFCKNPGDMLDDTHEDEASKGVTIGYSIRHPYMFVTNSRAYEVGDPVTFNYRNHWHIPYRDNPVAYLDAKEHIMFNAWDAGAPGPGFSNPSNENDYINYIFSTNGTIKEAVRKDYLDTYASTVTKSVYDPCPPKFEIPPIDAFRGIAQAKSSNTGMFALGTIEYSDYDKKANNAWTITNNGQSITFPMTGVRDYALRSTEWKSVENVDYEEFYRTSMPAFRMLTFVSSATIISKGSTNAYQLLIFAIDKSDRSQPHSTSNVKISCFSTSSNAYGMPVRPMRSELDSSN